MNSGMLVLGLVVYGVESPAAVGEPGKVVRLLRGFVLSGRGV
ncbi:hypothetical protein ACFXI0_09795 [Kitasatospora indigofera]